MTFLNLSPKGRLSLVNSDGYEVMSLLKWHDRYTAAYPANGEMMLVYNNSFYNVSDTTISFTVEWECDEDTPVVPPAEGYDSSDYLTLAETGLYERPYSRKGVYNWIIPCTGTLSIAEHLHGTLYAAVEFFNSSGTALFHRYFGSTFSTEYEVDGDFLVQLSSYSDFTTQEFFFLSWSCNGVRPELPSLAQTPAPATRAPPTMAPLPACEQTSSPLKASFAPENAYQYKKCWTFQCKGTVHMTFLNISSYGVVSLVNSDGYQLTSLTRYHDSYTASYPANGEMMIMSNKSNSYYHDDTVNFTVKWECDEDTPVVPPAEGYDSSEYLTLAQSGTYERLLSERRDYNWIIPCTGTLSIAEQVGDIVYAMITYISNGSTVLERYSGPSSHEYEVHGDFLIQLRSYYNDYCDNFFFLSWSCNGVRPELPSLKQTPAPATRAPPTMAPLPACEQTSSPLDASFPPENAYQFLKCWTFQCKGTVHMTFLNISSYGVLSLVNSNGYQLTSLTRYHDNYTASYPANGEMMILYNDNNASYHYDTVNFAVKWECDEDTPVVPPAEGYDSSDYLTLAQTGTYKRLFSQRRVYNWIIPCTGTLSIAQQVGTIEYAMLTYNISNGSAVSQSSASSNEYEVRGDFLIQLTGYRNDNRDNFFLLSWRCLPAGSTFAPPTSAPPTALPTATPTDLPATSSFAPSTSTPATLLPATPTDLPATRTPPTLAPMPACEQISSPLNASFRSEAYQLKCWTFQCKGTVHMAFLDFYEYGVLSLVNSNGYQLTAITMYHSRYDVATYPADGEMMILYNDSSYDYYSNTTYFGAEWECDEDTPVVPPAEGYDSSDYLTLAQSGTYKRLYSERRDYKWIIPCTGTLSIADHIYNTEVVMLTYINSNGSIAYQWSGYSDPSSHEYEVHGDFLIQLQTYGNTNRLDNFLFLSWSCDSVSGLPLTNSPVYSFAPTTYPPDTRTTTPDHPAGSTSAPTDLPATDLPAGSSFAPATSTPATLLPATPTDLPATRTPPTLAPMPACAEASSPLSASFRSEAYQLKCWTFQCRGTVHVAFLNFYEYGVLSLVNSNGYQLTSLTSYHDSYNGVYPANGEMMILYNDSSSYGSSNFTISFTVEWECNEDTPVVAPAVGYDSSDYLTLAQSGTYERLYSEIRYYKWIIPCTGTLSIADNVDNTKYVVFTYINSNGSTVSERSGYPNPSSHEYEVRGDFLILLRTYHNNHRDDALRLSWSCDSVSGLPLTNSPVYSFAPTTYPPDTRTTTPDHPAGSTSAPTDLPATDLPAGSSFAPATSTPATLLPATPTDLPATRTPPTLAPMPACEQISSPLNASFRSEAYQLKCWTFQCKGTVHVAFLNFYEYGVLSLVNSNGYQLTSVTSHHTHYQGYYDVYPANGEMMLLYNDSSSYGSFGFGISFTVEWECDEDTPVVPPAVGYDSSEYLTLAQSGTYERLYSEIRYYKWIIPCTGTLSIADNVDLSKYVVITYINSNGSTVWQFSGYPNPSSHEYEVRGDFLIQLRTYHNNHRDSSLRLSWSCDSVSGLPLTNSPVYSFAPTTYPPDTRTTTPDHPASSTSAPTDLPATDLPAGSSFAPPTSAPPTALPTATPTDLPVTLLPTTDLPAGSTSAPTDLPATQLPATDLPAGSSFAPPTSAPPTALPTATPTDLPAGATFAPPLPPSVNALCTTDEDCRSGRLDPKSTCEDGTCVCHTQGYAHPPGVPLCLLADDVTVPMAFAVEYDGVEAQSLWTTATTRESFEDTMGEALGTVTDVRVVVSDGGVLVVGMVRASTAKLADVLSGKGDLSAALSSAGVSVSHGVTCARTDASYTVQHNGVCNAVECEGNTTLTLADGTYRCEREAAPPQPEESSSSKMFLYVGIGVGVLGVAVGVVVAFCCLHKKQRAKELQSPLFEVPLEEEEAELYQVPCEEALN